uniref:Sulfotransferase domain-containing protein n=1 Tax=Clastoptera arizonana TaxID=38151 RepID=A0A1B6CQM8_9HEMI
MQNILMRFGLSQNLDFILPETANYIGNPEYFSSDLIGEDLRTIDNKYDIFTHHTRYNYSAIKAVMKDDAVFVTILRNPADLYESLFSYYGFTNIYNLTLESVINDYTKMDILKQRYFGRIGFNQISWDFGLSEEDISSTDVINEFIKKIEKEFDLIMIAEHMEASLVLLCHLMRWPIENVISLYLNARSPIDKHRLTSEERQKLLLLNSADVQLYFHFLKIFQKRVLEYGLEKMYEEITKLLNLNEQLSFRCVKGVSSTGLGKVVVFRVRDQKDWLCNHASLPELSFTSEIRVHQRKKAYVLQKFNRFMTKEFN